MACAGISAGGASGVEACAGISAGEAGCEAGMAWAGDANSPSACEFGEIAPCEDVGVRYV